ncbi:MAG: hypothetical protein U0174_22465 [Polyangiaceae bacterium]
MGIRKGLTTVAIALVTMAGCASTDSEQTDSEQDETAASDDALVLKPFQIPANLVGVDLPVQFGCYNSEAPYGRYFSVSKTMRIERNALPGTPKDREWTVAATDVSTDRKGTAAALGWNDVKGCYHSVSLKPGGPATRSGGGLLSTGTTRPTECTALMQVTVGDRSLEFVGSARLNHQIAGHTYYREEARCRGTYSW